MKLIGITEVNDALAQMVALFRVELRAYKGIVSKPNIETGREEMEEYLAAKFPVFAAIIDGKYAGYMVCRVDNEVVWWSPSSFGKIIAGAVLLLLYIARQRKSQLSTAKKPFTTMFIPITTG